MRVLEFVPPFGNKWPFSGSYYPAQMHVKMYKIEQSIKFPLVSLIRLHVRRSRPFPGKSTARGLRFST